jgi:hypothetical protein
MPEFEDLVSLAHWFAKVLRCRIESAALGAIIDESKMSPKHQLNSEHLGRRELSAPQALTRWRLNRLHQTSRAVTDLQKHH